MRPDEFFADDDDEFNLGVVGRHLDMDLMEQIRGGSVGRDDIEVAVPLAMLIHEELEKFGTSGSEEITDQQMRLSLRALRAVRDRLGVKAGEVPFRDFGTFKAWWLRNNGYGSWQARRNMLHDIFEPLHEYLAVREEQSLDSTLVNPVSPKARTGWAAVDTEISEMRRHFQNARTEQDYRAVGLDCVAVTEALSRHVYDPQRHQRPGEEEPPVANTKQRLDRFIEDSLPGPNNAAIRRLGKATIELAQQVKHSATPTRREAGIAADAIIQLANLLRRLDEPT